MTHLSREWCLSIRARRFSRRPVAWLGCWSAFRTGRTRSALYCYLGFVFSRSGRGPSALDRQLMLLSSTSLILVMAKSVRCSREDVYKLFHASLTACTRPSSLHLPVQCKMSFVFPGLTNVGRMMEAAMDLPRFSPSCCLSQLALPVLSPHVIHPCTDDHELFSPSAEFAVTGAKLVVAIKVTSPNYKLDCQEPRQPAQALISIVPLEESIRSFEPWTQAA